MKMKYKVGDKVKVREDLQVDCMYGGFVYRSFMMGIKEITIKNTSDVIAPHYDVKENTFKWTDKMLDGLIVDVSGDEMGGNIPFVGIIAKREVMKRTINMLIDKSNQEPLLMDIANKCGYGYTIYGDSMILHVNDKLSFFEELLIALQIDYVIKGGATKVLDN